jgi:CRP-like cAMP-binding protein
MTSQDRSGVAVKAAKAPVFSAQAFLQASGVAKTSLPYGRGEAIFTQGDPSDHVMCIQSGRVKLSVLSKTGKETVVAMLGPGDFFGEGCLVGQPLRMGSATAITPSTILRVRKEQMVLLLKIGTTRSRVNSLLNKFRKLGFIEYEGEVAIRIDRSLLSVVLHD